MLQAGVGLNNSEHTVSSNPYTNRVISSLDASDLPESKRDLTTVWAIAFVLSKNDNWDKVACNK